MSALQPEPVYLKDYKAAPFDVEQIALTFVLDDHETHVTNRMTIKRGYASNEPLVLNGVGLKLDRVILDGRPLHESEYELSDTELTLYNLPEGFTLEIGNWIDPESNKALEGLYKSGGIFCTQNEPEGFRKITYALDRPDVMSLYETKIIAKKAEYPVLLSNGNLIDSGDLKEGYHYALWSDPFAKPSYLYALVAGDLGLVRDHFITRSGRKIDLRIYCDKGNERQTYHAMSSLKRAMKWDEERFDREYDLDIYMIVAVDSFNMGAMENKGLNIFNSHYVLASQDTATDQDYLGIESVIGHEYFHNWTGNRITCRDWFQLTLKEGLTVFRDQSFSADLNDTVVQRISDVNMLRTRQFAEDASGTAHPIKPKSYLEINNFYTATIYEKGAEVIRMLQTLLGVEGFKKGMDLYFETFDGQAVTTEDFLWAMQEANDYNLEAFKKWYEQVGTPQLHVEQHYDEKNAIFSLKIRQKSQDGLKLFMPCRLALFAPSGETLYEEVQILEEQQTLLNFHDMKERPVLSFNRNFSAPVKSFIDQSDSDLAFLMAHDTDAFNRYEASQQFAIKIFKARLHDPSFDISSFIKAFEAIALDKSLSPLLKAQMLGFPTMDIIIQELEDIEIIPLYQTRNAILKECALALQEPLERLLDSLGTIENRIEGESMGKRALKNRLLELLYMSGKDSVQHYAFSHYQTALNMTDRFAMLKLLSNSQKYASQVQEDFYSRYKENTLVMNKYLSCIASSELPGTLERVIALQDDPVYDNIVPNLVRALLGSFARNHLHFHAQDGSGYMFIARKIISIDLFNPQIASGLAGAFKSYPKMAASQQEMMKKAMQKVLEVENLSKNVYEVLSRIIAH